MSSASRSTRFRPGPLWLGGLVALALLAPACAAGAGPGVSTGSGSPASGPGAPASAARGTSSPSATRAAPPSATPRATTSPGPVVDGLPAAARDAVLPATVRQGPLPSTAGLRAALAPILGESALAAAQTRTVVADAFSGAALLQAGGDDLVRPASTMKLLTATAALETLGPDRRLTTRTVLVAPSTVVLVGGGDPTLSTTPLPDDPVLHAARLVDLAAATAAALRARGLTAVTLAFDDSLFTGPALATGWTGGYLATNVAPVNALEVDGGRRGVPGDARWADPAAHAAAAFLAALRSQGITIATDPTGTVASPGGTDLAHVDSPPLQDLVEHMLTVSDNDVAEALLRHVALADGQPATFDGGSAAVTAALVGLGVPAGSVAAYDGSGLSAADRLRPSVLQTLLGLVASPAHPELRGIVTGLPVAGFTGTLAERYHSPHTAAGAGVVRAKTGTLPDQGTIGLAGFVQDASGALLVLVIVANGSPWYVQARLDVDRVATVLAGCGCG